MPWSWTDPDFRSHSQAKAVVPHEVEDVQKAGALFPPPLTRLTLAPVPPLSKPVSSTMVTIARMLLKGLCPCWAPAIFIFLFLEAGRSLFGLSSMTMGHHSSNFWGSWEWDGIHSLPLPLSAASGHPREFLIHKLGLMRLLDCLIHFHQHATTYMDSS